ncbi:carbon-nitrogen hydrolase family protein [Ktedonospora formicarum]|uniref:CN hydrolase domain-containing protein n=1 Tax=Ktedonospora formicarum TaxID=2778364 RepID=A0A8J3HZ20_9CHLR|nr:carbon-nitrogen hydrolase family protein [Ktedonospora formicarum]GHO43267.1 hypothetical protein KSX_14300 [Ktedonospora formicarum]
MRVTVCELPNERGAFSASWERLARHVVEQKSDLVLLPELPFSVWFCTNSQFESHIWQDACDEHEAMMKRLPELAPALVLGTHPLMKNGLRLNRGFCWAESEGYRGVHDKHYLPNEEGFYERAWFDRNQQDFSPVGVGNLALGFLICTEVMFNEWARFYGRQGANLIAVPRASTPHERWVVAPRMAAIASGAFVISSNRVDDKLFGGRGLIINPEGEVLAETSRHMPFVTVDIDLAESAQAKSTYPRDVPE